MLVLFERWYCLSLFFPKPEKKRLKALSYVLLSAEKAESLLLVHFFSGALALTAILTGFLAFKLYKLSKQHRRCAGKCYSFKATLSFDHPVPLKSK